MASSPRDREALDLIATRVFGRAYVATLELELQARRLTLVLYGALSGGATTALGTLRFYGTQALTLDDATGSFPESVRVATFALDYDDAQDLGAGALTGEAGWALRWSFDGVAYEEHPAVVASLADETAG